MNTSPTNELTADTAPNGWPRGLLQGFRDGDSSSLLAVYRLHADKVATLLRRGFTFRSGQGYHRFAGYHAPFEFQDALHETFRRAFEPAAREAYDGIRPYGPYLRTIAQNVVLKEFRRREALFPTAEGPASSEGGGVDDGDGSDPERSVHREQVRRLVRVFMEQLDTPDREFLELRFVEGLSQRDVAQRLGCGRQQVRSREQRLRKRMLRYLRNRGETELGDLTLLLLVSGSALGSSLIQAVK